MVNHTQLHREILQSLYRNQAFWSRCGGPENRSGLTSVELLTILQNVYPMSMWDEMLLDLLLQSGLRSGFSILTQPGSHRLWPEVAITGSLLMVVIKGPSSFTNCLKYLIRERPVRSGLYMENTHLQATLRGQVTADGRFLSVRRICTYRPYAEILTTIVNNRLSYIS